MTLFIVDASVAMGWTLQSQRTAACDALLRDAQAQFVAPFTFIYEVRNSILKAEREKRLPSRETEASLFVISSLVRIEPAPEPDTIDAAWTLARSARLTFYDATYVELALRLNAPLATRDKAQIRVGPSLGVTIYNAL